MKIVAGPGAVTVPPGAPSGLPKLAHLPQKAWGRLNFDRGVGEFLPRVDRPSPPDPLSRKLRGRGGELPAQRA